MFGTFLVKSMPYLMRFLSFVGTAAMLLVGGGIALHGIPTVGHGVELFVEGVASHPIFSGLLSMTANLIAGIVYGLIAYPFFSGLTKAFGFLKRSFSSGGTRRTASSST